MFRMKLVSRDWAKLIHSSADFIVSRQPQILYTYINGRRIRKFRSVSQQRVHPNDRRFEHVELHAGFEVSSPLVHGLLCLQFDESTTCDVRICNFFTGKSVRLLELQKNVEEETPLFFRWDPVYHQFKVLCVSVEKGLHEVLVMPQIFSLIGQSRSWRRISCTYPHLLIDSKSRWCKNGVIYNAAWNINASCL